VVKPAVTAARIGPRIDGNQLKGKLYSLRRRTAAGPFPCNAVRLHDVPAHVYLAGKLAASVRAHATVHRRSSNAYTRAQAPISVGVIVMACAAAA
jgi:hypothetical protein